MGKTDQQILRRFWIIIGLLSIVEVLFIGIVVKSYWSTGADEGTLISINTQYGASAALNTYYSSHGKYPPYSYTGAFYGPLTDDLTTPITIADRIPECKGPPIDPQRKFKIFPGEELKRAQYFGRYSKLFYKVNRGYPQRYYRSADGQVVFLFANGGDEDADVNPRVVLDGLSTDTVENSVRLLQALTYDATNGVPSSGDIWRIVTPDYP